MEFKSAENNYRQAIITLKEKGYPVLGWKFPTETDNLVAFIFTEKCVPATLPPMFIKSEMHEEKSVTYGRFFNPCPHIYEEHVKRSARAVLKWANGLPKCPVEIPRIRINIIVQ